MQDALNGFDQEAERIVKQFTGGLPAAPEIIYHYTNDIGLNGILETGRLWLTDVFQLNDPSELKHGFDIAIATLTNKVAGATPACNQFAKLIADCFERMGIQRSAQYFVCAFSLCGDDLGQWRAYADNGRGYALGFDGKVLEKAFFDAGDADAFPITYDDEALEKIDSAIVDAYFKLVDLETILRSGASKSEVADLCTSLTIHLLHAAIFFKHKAYKNEQEYRFLKTYRAGMQISGLKRRPRRYSFIEYAEFDWKSAPHVTPKRLIVGPSDQMRAGRFAENCLRLTQTQDISINYSAIPYRAE
jgi:hypothetical protein